MVSNSHCKQINKQNLDCVGAQAGVAPGDILVSANEQSLISASGKEAQKTILRAVTDLNLIVQRKQYPTENQNQVSYQSPAKISRRAAINFQYSSSSSSSSDTSEDTDDHFAQIHGKSATSPLGDRLKGMDVMLKFDTGIKETKLIQSGREFIYSGSCKATISGMFY